MSATFEPAEPSITATETWLRDFVVEHELCPFAKRELNAGRIRTTVTNAADTEALLETLIDELMLLENDLSIATTLLVHPCVLSDFVDYNNFLDIADGLLREMNLEGVIQIASFHPDYVFADAEQNDPANYTNRSPLPLLHLLREEDVARAIDSHADIHSIPQRNIAYLRALPAGALPNH
ncbi:MAG: DUF1415 domain-containing protein [Halioglobus sp.]